MGILYVIFYMLLNVLQIKISLIVCVDWKQWIEMLFIQIERFYMHLMWQTNMEYNKELIILLIGIIKEGFCEKIRLLQIYLIKPESEIIILYKVHYNLGKCDSC